MLSVEGAHEREMLLVVVAVAVRLVGVVGGVVSVVGGGVGEVAPAVLNVLSASSRVGWLVRSLPAQVQAKVIVPVSCELPHCVSMWFSSVRVGQRQLESLNACTTPQ